VALVGIAPSLIVSLLFPATAVLLLRRLGRVAAIADEGAPAGSRLDLRPGARWLRSSPVAISVVLIGALMSLAVYSYFAPLPIVVARTLGSDAGAQGVAMALGGVAILAIGLSLGRILRRFGTGRVLIAGVFASAFFVAGLGLAESAAVAVVVLTLLPMCTNIQYATCNLLLQQLAPAAVRGRVLGLFTLTFVLLEPIGMAGVSALSQVAGEQIVLVGMGIVTTLSVGLIVLLRPAILRAGAAAPA
jgi:Transmembrane secretion effector